MSKTFTQKLTEQIAYNQVHGSPAAIAAGVIAKEMAGAGYVENNGGTHHITQKIPEGTGSPNDLVNSVTAHLEKNGYTYNGKEVDGTYTFVKAGKSVAIHAEAVDGDVHYSVRDK